MTQLSRRRLIQAGGSAVLASALPVTALHAQTMKGVTKDKVNMGILHSLTGTFAFAEAGMVKAEKLAVDEINAAGGIMGRQIVPFVEDGASEPATFAEKANVLLRRDNVAAIVGCYSSATRKAVLPVLAQTNGLLYYPTYYEGEEEDPHVLYTSQEATQSVIIAVDWIAKKIGKKIYLVGSDYIYPRVCNKIAKAYMKKIGATVAGEDYYPLGTTDFSVVINKIKAAKPDAVYNTVVGSSNVAFYKQMNAAGLGGKAMTIMSTLLEEDEVAGLGTENAVDTYSTMGYFQSLKNPVNEKFVAAFKAKYGPNSVIGYVMECGYNSVHLWKLAVEKAKSFEPQKVIAASAGLGYDSPEGPIHFDEKNHHTWMQVRVGRVRPDGQFDVVYETPGLVHPDPFPKFD